MQKYCFSFFFIFPLHGNAPLAMINFFTARIQTISQLRVSPEPPESLWVLTCRGRCQLSTNYTRAGLPLFFILSTKSLTIVSINLTPLQFTVAASRGTSTHLFWHAFWHVDILLFSYLLWFPRPMQASLPLSSISSSYSVFSPQIIICKTSLSTEISLSITNANKHGVRTHLSLRLHTWAFYYTFLQCRSVKPTK